MLAGTTAHTFFLIVSIINSPFTIKIQLMRNVINQIKNVSNIMSSKNNLICIAYNKYTLFVVCMQF